MLDVFVHQREEFHSSIIGGALTQADVTVRGFLATHSAPELANLAYTQSTILSYAYGLSAAVARSAISCLPLIFLMRRRRRAGAPPKVEIEVEMG